MLKLLALALCLATTLAFLPPAPMSVQTRRNLFGGGGGDKAEGGGGGGGLGGMMDQMKKMTEIQKRTKEMQEELAQERVTGESADGLVKVTFNGAQEAVDASVDDAKLDEWLKRRRDELVSAAVLEAIKDGQNKSTQVMMKKMSELYAGLGLGGAGAPNMPGM